MEIHAGKDTFLPYIKSFRRSKKGLSPISRTKGQKIGTDNPQRSSARLVVREINKSSHCLFMPIKLFKMKRLEDGKAENTYVFLLHGRWWLKVLHSFSKAFWQSDSKDLKWVPILGQRNSTPGKSVLEKQIWGQRFIHKDIYSWERLILKSHFE